MRQSKHIQISIFSLDNLKTLSLCAYFVFNFINRDISSFFLLLALILCLIDYKKLYMILKEQQSLVIAVTLFSVWVTFIGIYYESPLHELDNYYRFLLLIPLLIIAIKDYQLIFVLNICAVGALGHLFYTYLGDDIGRYQGTSSNAITYANLCALLSIMCIYYFFIKKHHSIYLLLSSLVFLYILVVTQTRGPFIGIIISFIYLIFLTRSRLLVTFISIIFISLIFVPNPLIDRIKVISQINLELQNDTANFKPIHGSISINERVFYLKYGLDKIKHQLVFGIGPHHLEKEMLDYTKRNNINIEARDHLHNEFLDISVKFGIPALILLLLIYFVLYKSSDKDNRVIMNLLLIMLLSSQLTQSQFSHHQAITFFIVLAYFIIKSNKIRI
jgi:O-antigen ligase